MGKACNTPKEGTEDQQTHSNLEAHFHAFDFPKTEFTEFIWYHMID